MKNLSLRQRLIWVNPNASDLIQIQDAYSHNARDYINNWISKNRPLIGRSKNQFDKKNGDSIPVGLMAFMPNGTKERLNLLINSSLVSKIDNLPLLSTALEILPQDMRSEVNNFLENFEDDPIIFRVYGSVMWSYEGAISGINPNSDIDLLIQLTDFCDVVKLANKLVYFSKLCKMRLDGEFEFQNGNFVNWRELSSGETNFLVKTNSEPKLVTREWVIKSTNASFN